jgi:hypothetical protein
MGFDCRTAGTKAVKQHITGNIVANEIRMLRTQHKGSFIVVEGWSDARVYEELLDASVCRVMVAYNKENAITALRILYDCAFEGALVIIDADFDRVLDRTLQGNTFYSDGHDLEVMLLSSNAVYRLLKELGSEEKIKEFERAQSSDLIGALFRKAMPLSRLRLLSLSKGLSLDFDGLQFSHFTDRNSLDIDVEQLATILMSRSKSFVGLRDDLIHNLTELDVFTDLNEMCVGHDILELLAIGLRKCVGSCKAVDCTAELLGRLLRLAYSFDDFVTTNLYKELRRWEHENRTYRLFAVRASVSQAMT